MDFLQPVLQFLPTLPAQWAADISFILSFVVVSLAFGFYFGRTWLVTLSICSYIAFSLLHVLPPGILGSHVYAEAGFFMGVLILLVIVGDYLFDIHISNASADFFRRILIMSFLSVGMVASIILSLLPQPLVLEYLSSHLYGYLVGPWASVVWMALPVVFLFFINKRLR